MVGARVDVLDFLGVFAATSSSADLFFTLVFFAVMTRTFVASTDFVVVDPIDRALDRRGVIDDVVDGGAEGARVATAGVAGARPQPDRDRGLTRRIGQRQPGRRGAAHRRRPRRDRGQARTRGVDDARGGTRLRGAVGGCLVEVGQAVVGGARDVLDAARSRTRRTGRYPR